VRALPLLLCAACSQAQAQGPPDGGAIFDSGGAFVAFNHKVHVTENLIGCSVCHPYARHSAVAGLVSMAGCMGCHRFAGREKPAIRALAAAFAEGKPLQFPRVFRQPDHVRFNHERHLARGLECAECHGEVAHMAQDVPARDMHMGFCMECHRARQASTDCLACHK
jgi:hypothetical protein